MAYVLSSTHNPFWIEDNTLFANPRVYRATVDKIKEEFNRSDEEFIITFKSKYANPLPPSFILLEITSFGTLSRLYDNLKPGKSRKEIAKMFGLPDKVFASWLHSFVYIRNVCAHHARIWNRWLRVQPLFSKNATNKWITDKRVGNNRLYYALSMMIYLLNTVNPNHRFKQKLETLFTCAMHEVQAKNIPMWIKRQWDFLKTGTQKRCGNNRVNQNLKEPFFMKEWTDIK